MSTRLQFEKDLKQLYQIPEGFLEFDDIHQYYKNVEAMVLWMAYVLHNNNSCSTSKFTTMMNVCFDRYTDKLVRPVSS